MTHMKSAIVTGPTGAIGIALIDDLLSNGVKVYAVTRSDSKRISRIPKGAVTVLCPFDEIDNLPELINDKVDIFYNLAWGGASGNGRNDVSLQLSNVLNSVKAVEAAASLGCSKFIGTGSQAEYGRVNEKLTPFTATNPENGYGIAKLSAGYMTRLRCKQLGLQYDWVRILSVYGPFDGENTLIISLIRQLLAGIAPKLTPGDQLWDYIYSRDAAEALRLIGEKGRDGSVYCLGSGVAHPLKEYVKIIRDMIAPDVHLDFGAVPYSDNQIMHLCADISLLTEHTGFIPAIDFRSGIKNTVEWCLNNN